MKDMENMPGLIENKDVSAPAEATSPRLEWITPAIRRMSLGSAENGGRAASDGGIFTS